VIALLLAVTTAQAAHSSIWTRQLVGVGGWPTGALSDTRVQLRTPGHRSDSVLFRDTYYGAGARVQVSPAFVDVGPRLSIAPIDVFDLDLQASWTGYAGPFAPLPLDGITGKTEAERGERDDEHFALSKVELSAAPTLKGKLGPLIVFDSTTVAWVHAMRPEDQTDERWYEPYRDLSLAWTDVTVENQGAVVGEILDGDERPKLWVGATGRHRRAVVSGDYQTHAGLLVVCKPGTGAAVPTFVWV
jgi:hypothetical protein